MKVNFLPRRKKSESGLTLVELLVSLTLFALVVGLTTQTVVGALDTWNHSRDGGSTHNKLLQTGQRAMEKMVRSVRATNWVLMPLRISDPLDPRKVPSDLNPDDGTDYSDPVLYPNGRYFARPVLAVAGLIDNDGDGRVDEDPDDDITGDNAPGILGIDDNWNGEIDFFDTHVKFADDDDEDVGKSEDQIDGIDNDGDGRYDEDPDKKWNSNSLDIDGDGLESEDPFDPLIYELVGSSLTERQNVLAAEGAATVIAENVTLFEVVRRRVNKNTLIDITLRLEEGGGTVELRTTALAKKHLKW
jgi:hypothetical protein